MMRRRDFLAASLAAVAGTTLGRRTARAADAGTRPNIVYVLADDLGWGDLRCLNPQGKIPTPHLDALAGAGRVFTDAHSGSAVCTPTRYGTLTGRYCWRSRLKRGVLDGWSAPLIEPGRQTVAALLKDRGYHTACVGKWHLGLDWTTAEGKPASRERTDYARPFQYGPCALGFDEFFGISASLDMPPYVYIRNDRVEEPPSGTLEDSPKPAYYRGGPVAPGFQMDRVLERLTDEAVGVVQRHKERADESPLFLYFPLTAPHTPIFSREEFRGKGETTAYGDFVYEVDASVGRLRAALAEAGMAENTLFIFTSDNGFAPMADLEELAAKGHHPSGPFRGHKADIFEGGHRIPFIAAWPGRVAPGTSCSDTVCLTDLLATAAEITGAAPSPDTGEDSWSLLPLLEGRPPAAPRPAVVHHSVDGFFALREGKWKFIDCPGSGGWSAPTPNSPEGKTLPPVQLYDLEADPGETANLCDKHPEQVERLRGILEQFKQAGRSV
jgi:arylsulfatase A-like enzyme